MFIWVGLQVDPKLLTDVFGAGSIGQLDVEMVSILYLNTDLDCLFDMNHFVCFYLKAVQ